MNARLAALCLGATASLCSAQNGHATWTWQISVDDGLSWRTGVARVGPGQDHVRCRVLLDWTPDAGYAYSGCNSFDPYITGVDGAGPQDSVTEPVRPYPFAVSNQTLATTRFGNLIKIDDSRDTLPPGFGTRGVFPSQYVEQFSGGQFTTEHPVSVFEFHLNLDGSTGRRTIGQYFVAPSDFPSIRIYTTPEGMQNNLRILPSGGQVTFIPAEIRVVACPADFNDDAQLDFFDYLDFIAAFAAEDPRADFDNNGRVDFFDYLDLVEAFTAGCD